MRGLSLHSLKIPESDWPEAATPEADIVIAAENIQHRRAVIHGVAFHRRGLLLRFIAAQDEEQIAIVLVEIIGRCSSGGDRKRPMTVFEEWWGFNLFYQRGDMFLTAANGAEGVFLPSTSWRLRSQVREIKPLKGWWVSTVRRRARSVSRTATALRIFPGLVEHSVAEAPIVAVGTDPPP